MTLARLLVLLAVLSSPLNAATESPEELVVRLYEKQSDDKGPFFQTSNENLVSRYFAKPLATLIWKDALTADGEVGAIDFDPLYDSNDPDPQDFTLEEAESQSEDTAIIEATFTQHGESHCIRYFLKEGPQGWRITDINYGGKRSLLGILRKAYP